jgi:hypothetical protein
MDHAGVTPAQRYMGTAIWISNFSAIVLFGGKIALQVWLCSR